MKKQEMADLLLRMLGEILASTGFKLKKQKSGFERRISGGRQMLGLPLWDYNPDFEFSLNICIRIHSVEDIFHQFSGAPPQYHSMSFTTMTRLDRFTEGPAKYVVSTAEDVANTGRILSTIIREQIIPFYDSHRGVEALDKGINGDSPSIDNTQNPGGAMHSIIVARLAGNNEFNRLVDKHRENMQLAAEAAHPFNHLVKFLEIHR